MKRRTWYLAATLGIALLLVLPSTALAKRSSSIVTFTTTADFLQGTITNLQMPPWCAPTSPYGELRLGGSSPVWALYSSWNGPAQSNKSYTSPALGDLDGDGDLDLLVGLANGATIAYENVGDKTAPSWSRKSAWDAPAMGSGQYAVPTLADLDGDGDLDLAVGRYDRSVYVYRNDGPGTAPSWTRVSAWDPPALSSSNHAAPAFTDLDLDGLPDIVIGANDDNNVAYQNTGVLGAPVWTRRADWDPPSETSRGWTELAFGDLNCDRLPELYLGDSKGGVTIYRNDGTAGSPVWTAVPAWNPPQIAAFATPALGNLDDDRDLDLIVGAQRGTLDCVRNGDLGSTTPGQWLSPVVDAGSDGWVWASVAATERQIGSGGALLLEARGGGDTTTLAASPWSTVTGATLPEDCLQRYVQIRVTFTTTDPAATPVLEDLTLASVAPVTGIHVTYATYRRGLVALAWDAGAGATTYDIYRNGELVGTTDQTVFEDGPGRQVWRTGAAYVVMARGSAGQLLAAGTFGGTALLAQL